MASSQTATSEAPQKSFSLGRFLIGRRLETTALPHQVVSNPIGLAVFASDALSSTAYSIEEILIILALAGTGAGTLGLSIPITFAIVGLLIILTISYRQTIHAYPNGGGAYIVARDNLGELPAQIAGAALLTDYILTVAVSISSGVAQITSGFHELYPYRVEMAVGVIALMTIVNLRGVRESGRIFAIPTYFFLFTMLLMLLVGLVKYAIGDLGTVTGVHDLVRHDAQALTLFLVLRAFSSGCTALTGVEAISNGITAFKDPKSHNAARTLTYMSTIMVVLMIGLTLLTHQVGALPSERETIFSQVGRTVFGGESIFYAAVLAATALILLMAANTSYADFPRLAALHAGDGFLPRQLTIRGGRLVFSWGIMGLATMASVLVIVTQASVTALIPLYAIGVFLSFTMSQSGMVVRLRKIGRLQPGQEVPGRETVMRYDPHWRLHLAISAIGAICTGMVMVIFAITKFANGAWFVVLLIPTLVFIFFRIHFHYRDVARALRLAGGTVDVEKHPIQTIILVDDVHAETVGMVNFAKSLDHPWHAVHIAVNPAKVDTVKEKWDSWIGEGKLVIIPSPYRLLADPLRQYIEELQAERPGSYVHVILGHLAMDTYWEQALHQNSAVMFNLALSRMDRVVVTSVPYRIRRNGKTHKPAVDQVQPVPERRGAIEPKLQTDES